MSLQSWLRSFRARCVRSAIRRDVSAKRTNRLAELLEPRCLLAVTPLIVNNTDLLVQLESSDNVTLQADASGNLEILLSGSLVIATPTIAVNTLTSISVFGGDGPNRIDLTNVTVAAFDAALTVTVNGGDGNDTILGSEFADSLIGGNGADSLVGALADDTLEGGNGLDTLVGGVANDSLFGGDGADSISGDAGDDTIVGGNGADNISGGDGLDSINGGDGADTLSGNAGEDTLSGDNGNDSLLGGTEDDSILGGAGNDTASGGDGDDTISGNLGNDSLDGDDGLDSIDGNDGNDIINGGDGDDTLNGGTGHDTALGASGNDSLLGGAGNDLLGGGLDDDTVLGQAGNDTLFGGAGTDSLDGGAGNDLLQSLGASLSIAATSMFTEGDTGTTQGTITVTLAQASPQTIRVSFRTENGTALAGSDYQAKSGLLTFAPGVVSQTISIGVIGDTLLEGSEDFRVILSNPQNSVLDQAVCVVTILDNEGASSQTASAADLARMQQSRFAETARRITAEVAADPQSKPKQWILSLKAGVSPITFAKALGLPPLAPTGHLLDTYTVTFSEDHQASQLPHKLAGHTDVAFFYPLVGSEVSTRLIPNDPLFPDQWHLRNTGQTGGTVGADANVELAWDTFLGSGVVIGIVDDGLQHTHPDLNPNYVAALSFDFLGNDTDPTPVGGADHGTAVAGVAAARGFNALGVTGSAPSASLAGLRLVDFGQTDLLTGNALTFQNQNIDIYNNSWGPADDGQSLDAMTPLTLAAVQAGTTSGRGGLGSIYTWAAGNGLGNNDNVNYDGFANSRFVIAVAAVDDDGVQAPYSEPGAPILVTAYSSGTGVGITTTDLVGTAGSANGDYRNDFGGTSSATPLVSGVIALMLEANPNLTYRDVKHILVDTAEQNDPTDADWVLNGAGHLVNHQYGFGAIDALASVNAATTHVNVAAETTVISSTITVNAAIPDNSPAGVTSLVNIAQDIDIEMLEVTFDATHTARGNLEVILTSPAGTQSILAEDRNDPNADYTNWIFTSARHWDESTQGTWTLQVRDLVAGTVGTFDSWQISFYGTVPQAPPPGPGPGPAPGPGAGSADTEGDTLTGSDGNDTIVGADGDDFINGMAGNDSLSGGAGNDDLFGGAGNDTLDGGADDDTVNGQGGNDQLAGGAGSDTFVWNGNGDGQDTLSSLSGYDRVRVQGTAAANNYVVSQVSGQIRITDGIASLDVSPIIQVVDIFAGEGNDTITIGALDRVRTATLLTVNGEDGNDRINSNGANIGLIRVSLVGGPDDDTLTGSSGIDSLDGGDGDDSLNGQGGNDLIFGGLGDDTIAGGAGNDRIFAGDGNDSIDAGAGDDSVIGDVGADTINGSDGNDTLDGGDGTDTINGGSGNDSILGGNEADALNGSTGNDTVLGGSGDDTIIGENGNDKLSGEDGNDSILGFDGDDTINGGDGDDTLDGGNGNDLVGGGNGDDLMNGAAGNDTLTGGDGNDTIAGGAGNDVLLGDEGDDSLNGQGSTDIINPGEGSDTVLDPIDEIDTTFTLSAALLAALA
jgi:Ca2+-binding RTX toxin-like protein